ncbi:MAG: isoprenylcysteine carboxyl methyltransferase family protein [Hyphomicrobiaceae bacterium]
MLENVGLAQAAALIVLAQRGFEELYSKHNTRALLGRGGREEGAEYYPVVAVTHLAWIAALFFLIPSNAAVTWPLIALYVVLQVARYWIIVSLGPFWTHRIITLPGAPIQREGPYQFVRHPNYVVTILETLVLPLAFGAVFLALIMTAIWSAVIYYKIVLEDAALEGRRRSYTTDPD